MGTAPRRDDAPRAGMSNVRYNRVSDGSSISFIDQLVNATSPTCEVVPHTVLSYELGLGEPERLRSRESRHLVANERDTTSCSSIYSNSVIASRDTFVQLPKGEVQWPKSNQAAQLQQSPQRS